MLNHKGHGQLFDLQSILLGVGSALLALLGLITSIGSFCINCYYLCANYEVSLIDTGLAIIGIIISGMVFGFVSYYLYHRFN